MSEGSPKPFWTLMAATFLVVCVSFWPQTKFMVRFLSDLVVLNLVRNWHSLVSLAHYFWQRHHPGL